MYRLPGIQIQLEQYVLYKTGSILVSYVSYTVPGIGLRVRVGLLRLVSKVYVDCGFYVLHPSLRFLRICHVYSRYQVYALLIV